MTVITTGICVKAALDASAALADKGIELRVLDAAWIKPIDQPEIIAAARETGAMLAVETHNPNGGLGGAVAEIVAKAGIAVRFRRLALPDDYVLEAPPTHLHRHCGLTAVGVSAAVKSLLGAHIFAEMVPIDPSLF